MNNPTIANIQMRLKETERCWEDDDIRFLLAEIDRLNAEGDMLDQTIQGLMQAEYTLSLDLHEVRAQQAHTASCNIELMRKLEKANEAQVAAARKETEELRELVNVRNGEIAVADKRLEKCIAVMSALPFREVDPAYVKLNALLKELGIE